MAGAGKTVLLTGATGGIGSAVSRRLAKSGYSVLLAARDEAKLRTLCDELSRTVGGSHSWISVDMTRDESVKVFADELEARGVTLDGRRG